MRIMLRTAAAAALSAALICAAYASESVFPVPKRVIYPGDTITEDMITLKPAEQMNGAGTLVTGPDSLIGKAARRTLLPGQPIPKVALRDPYVVFQGKTVQVVFESGTIMITGVALALQPGSAGETITARNPDSGIVIHGVVQPDGSLRAE